MSSNKIISKIQLPDFSEPHLLRDTETNQELNIHINNKNNPHEVTAEQIGLDNSINCSSKIVSMPLSKPWWSLAYGNGKFVAVTYGYDIAAYSSDGITWEQSTLPISANWTKVVYGNGKFVAIPYGSSSNIVAYSTDGITWEQSTLPVRNNSWKGLAFGNGKFVIIAASTQVAMYSEDGITW